MLYQVLWCVVQILVDGQLKGTVDGAREGAEVTVDIGVVPAVLDIVVENMGRVNYTDSGNQLMNNQRKGAL